MNREQPNELIQPLVHVPVELGERCEVLPDPRLLLARLLEKPLGDDEFHVFAGDEDLLEAVLHTAQAVSDVGKAMAVEDCLLHTGNEAEA